MALESEILHQMERQNDLLAEMLEEQRKIRWEARTTRRELETVRTLIAAPMLDDIQSFADARQLGFLETVERLRDEEQSFARFGDGEIQIMLRPTYKLAFQDNSPHLASCLAEVIQKPIDGLLLGFPDVYRDLNWARTWGDTWGQFKELVNVHAELGNTHVTRPVFFHNTGEAGVKAWRAVWENKSVTVVTGRDSRFELIPALFDSARDFTFLESFPRNAFADVPRLLDELLAGTSDIALIALGPAGTILAAEMARAGRRAIDIGHISASYHNAFDGGAWPEKLPLTTP